jgi:hypothetical protein
VAESYARILQESSVHLKLVAVFKLHRLFAL